jgi:hypothetical protein
MEDFQKAFEKSLAQIKNPIAREFYRRAMEVVRSNGGSGFVIKHGQAEFEAWSKYFDRLGWRPHAMKLSAHNPKQEITMPTQWPEWFDTAKAA